MEERQTQLRARLAAHDLVGRSVEPDDVAILACGFQDAGPGTASAALALRSSPDGVARAIADGALVTVLSLRGAPHLHRRADVERLRAAMVPADRRDLEAVCGPVPDAVADRDDPVDEVATAMAAVLDGVGGDEALAKAALSSAVTPAVDPALGPFCGSCGTRHVLDGLFRLATLRARLAVVPQGRTQAFVALSDEAPARPADAAVAEARRWLVTAAARASAPVDVEQVAAWLGWHRSTVAAMGAEPAADGGRARPCDPPAPAPGEQAPAPGERAPRRSVRLLPARDPWLRGSDRGWLLGANVDRRGEVFRSLHAPGVVLADGEVAGTWRQRASGSRLDVALDPWRPWSAAERDEVDADARVVAASRGLTARLTRD